MITHPTPAAGSAARPAPDDCHRCDGSGYREIDEPEIGITFCTCPAGHRRAVEAHERSRREIEEQRLDPPPF